MPTAPSCPTSLPHLTPWTIIGGGGGGENNVYLFFDRFSEKLYIFLA